MADFAASRTSCRASLTYTVAREIILMDIMLGLFRSKAIDDLLVAQRSERSDRQDLCLSTREKTRAMRTRQKPDFAADRTHFFDLTAIRTDFLMRNHAAYDFFYNFMQHIGNFLGSLRVIHQEMLHRIRFDCCNVFIAIELVRIPYSFIELIRCKLTNCLLEFFCYLEQFDLTFWLAAFFYNLLLEFDNLLDFFVAKQNRFKNDLLRQLVGTSFNHHDCIVRTGNRKIKLRLLTLLCCRVDDELSIDAANAYTCNRPVKRDIRYTKCTRRTDHCSNFRCIVLICRKNRSNDLDIVAETLSKKRTDWPVNQTTAKNRRLARTSLSLYKTAWNLSGSIHLFFIIHGKREKIHTLTRLS